MSKGRTEMAEKVIMRGARLNGRTTFSTHLVKDSVSKAGKKKKEEEEEEGQDKQYSARDLFRGKEERVKETTMVFGEQFSCCQCQCC